MDVEPQQKMQRCGKFLQCGLFDFVDDSIRNTFD